VKKNATQARIQPNDGMVRVRGAREHNLKNVDLDIPRDALVVFTGVSQGPENRLSRLELCTLKHKGGISNQYLPMPVASFIN
jgi:hypothetical protein